MFAVLVTFAIKPGRMPDFLPLMRDNAQTSVREEPGCRQFDVLTTATATDEVVLYELYDDRAAFDVHLASDHFRAFDAATADMIADKDVRLFETVLR